MKNILLSIFLLIISKSIFADYSPQTGDVVFQVLLSDQSRAIQLATKSQYSHVGIVIVKNNEPMVFEAVGPVRYIKWKDWVEQGDKNHYVAKRMKNPLSEEIIKTIVNKTNIYEGKAYDFPFSWTDEKIYCSELVWKLYKAADIELAPLTKLGSFDLTHPAVKAKLKERYGNNIPLDEKVVPPSALFDSELLITVDEK
jgi:uncharacterized protein YycO